MADKPVIGITMGDFNGIGPEIIIKCMTDTGITRLCAPLIIGSKSVFEKGNIMALPDIPLPGSWPKRIKSAILRVISLAHWAIVYTRSMFANSTGDMSGRRRADQATLKRFASARGSAMARPKSESADRRSRSGTCPRIKMTKG